jgi:hypothetical protein
MLVALIFLVTFCIKTTGVRKIKRMGHAEALEAYALGIADYVLTVGMA